MGQQWLVAAGAVISARSVERRKLVGSWRAASSAKIARSCPSLTSDSLIG